MSGIAGIFNLDGRPANPETLKRMSAALSHRGPDHQGSWRAGPVGFVHCLLATTPESVSEEQPLLDETGALCLTLDGRVDNREELGNALRAKGARLRTDTDGELVLRAYEIWGEECPAKIIGDFAFAIWDMRKRQLLCARDPLGIRPLYCYKDDRRFLFASEMQPIFMEPEVERKPNFATIGRYLGNNFEDQEQTRYANVVRVTPNHSVIVTERNLQNRQYWDLDRQRSIRYATDEEYAEHFLSLFQESVRCRLRSRGPLAARLSGGLDSSSIVCTARKLLRENAVPDPGFETFSNVYPGLPCDERKYIDEVLRHCGVKESNFFVYYPDVSYAELSRAADYPDVLYHPITLVNVRLYKKIQARGINVVLDGMGGDELLAAGCEHLGDLLAAGRLRQLWAQAQCDSRSTKIPIQRLLFTYCVIPFVPQFLKPILRPVHRFLRGYKPYRCVNPAFLRSVGVNRFVGRPTMKRTFPTRAQQRLYEGLFVGWNATVAMEIMDLFTARFSIELRYPFFDRRLVEFLMAIPSDQRWRGENTKFILRTAMKGILPEAIRLRRGKAEFSPVMDIEMTRHQSADVESLFRCSVMAKHGILDQGELTRLFDRYQQNTEDEYLLGQVVFLVGLELWFLSMMETPTTRQGVS
jgi:asparagine synthase (glutamine-hydrolysing)